MSATIGLEATTNYDLQVSQARAGQRAPPKVPQRPRVGQDRRRGTNPRGKKKRPQSRPPWARCVFIRSGHRFTKRVIGKQSTYSLGFEHPYIRAPADDGLQWIPCRAILAATISTTHTLSRVRELVGRLRRAELGPALLDQQDASLQLQGGSWDSTWV